MTGRGAWSVQGIGGTLEYGADGSTRPGPYYALAIGDTPKVGSGGWKAASVNERAVHGAVLAYQRALNRQLGGLPGFDVIVVDGVYGEATRDAVFRWQKRQPKFRDISVWGGIGPSTSKWLLMPTLRTWVADELEAVVCGLVTQESGWDVGAVGFVDDDDIGLGQINGPANPDLTERERLRPSVAFPYVQHRVEVGLENFDGNLRDAVASYNLGFGGANSWIKAGRPDMWQPTPGATPRNVRTYIDFILSACANTARSTT